MKSEESGRKVSDWMGTFSELYSEVDSNRTPEEIWIAVMAHASSIGESIRRIHFPDLLYYASHTFCWLCSFINKCNKLENHIFSFAESLSGIVSLKYPLRCGHCEESHCQCHPTKMDEIRDKSAHYEELLDIRKGILESVEGYSVAQWKNAFGDIYGEQIHILPLESIGFHFLEEAGEGAVAVRKLSQLKSVVDEKIEGIDAAFLGQLSRIDGIVNNYKEYSKFKPEKEEFCYTSKDPNILKWRMVDAKLSMAIEIADTFSWFCSILNKLESIYKNCDFEPLSLEDKLFEQYFGPDGKRRCPTCENAPCECIFSFS